LQLFRRAPRNGEEFGSKKRIVGFGFCWQLFRTKNVATHSLMTTKKNLDYVLGTHDEEVARLGLQHRVWRDTVLACWRKAGIGAGRRVLDVGAGPGYAAIDLAEMVGHRGEVLAVERSARFLDIARTLCAGRGLSNVRFQEADLMAEAIEGTDFDAAWCRWVASFVKSPARLVQRIAEAVRREGIVIFHEYIDYATFRMAPRRLAVESFVNEVMESWRAAGGEPDVALLLPPLLRDSGLRVLSATPLVFAISTADAMWQWPASFIEVNLARLRDLGRVTPEWVESVRREFREGETDPATLITTPMVLEIVAQRE
jgi:SAM-dependent methyltransferase